MARPKGSKNANSLNVSSMFKAYWGKPAKITKLNVALMDIIDTGSDRDKLSAISTVLKYTAVSADKQLESETITQEVLTRNDVLDGIKKIQAKLKPAP